MAKTVNVRITRSSGHVMLANPLAAPGDGIIAITDVPDAVAAAAVARQFGKVCMWPIPSEIAWPAIAGKPPGAIIR